MYSGVFITNDIMCWPGSPFIQKSSVKIIQIMVVSRST